MTALKPLLVVALTLFLISFVAATQTIRLDLDTKKTGAPISKYIYGQFIEHLGRCIYGGIWAEMLEDRKFYYPVTPEYHPYTQLLDTPFPIIGHSPWQIVSGEVSMLDASPSSEARRGEGGGPVSEANRGGGFSRSVSLGIGTEIRQNDLGTVKGKQYTGYLWARATHAAELSLTLSSGGKATVKVDKPGFVKYSFQFTATETTDKASFEIRRGVHLQMGESAPHAPLNAAPVVIGCVSLMPADNIHGMRRDTIACLKQLGGTIYRWPGGNFVSGYDWRDGIGDRDRRAPKANPAWTGIESNDFGTDEFVAFCREIGADPLITVNTGFGDAYSAAQWVEYCNAGPNTVGGKWRVDNGHREPYGVRHWCVGNEMWGPWQLGFMQLSQYVIKHNWVSEAMKKVDPSLILVASGDLDTINKDHDPDQAKRNIGWSQGMLEGCSQNMDYISEHFYCGRLPWTKDGQPDILASVAEIKKAIKEKTDGHRKMQPQVKELKGRIVPIAMDEWNYWHREYTYGEIGCAYDLADGLGIAEGLHEFYRQSDLVTLATYAQTVNVIGAIKTSRTAAELESTGLVLEMYRHHFGTRPLKIDAGFGPYDVAAALTEDGKSLTVGIVNPTPSPIKLDLSLSPHPAPGAMTRYCLTGKEPTSHNAPGTPRQVDILETSGLDPAKGLELPAYACAIFVIPMTSAIRHEAKDVFEGYVYGTGA